jgi:hypothetical protein
MTITERLIAEAAARGITLEHGGGTKLNVTWLNEWDYAQLKERLRAHKLEILAVLELRQRVAAVHTARQIIDGEFNGASASTIQDLIVGLRSIQHPLCRRALERFEQKAKA